MKHAPDITESVSMLPENVDQFILHYDKPSCEWVVVAIHTSRPGWTRTKKLQSFVKHPDAQGAIHLLKQHVAAVKRLTT